MTIHKHNLFIPWQTHFQQCIGGKSRCKNHRFERPTVHSAVARQINWANYCVGEAWLSELRRVPWLYLWLSYSLKDLRIGKQRKSLSLVAAFTIQTMSGCSQCILVHCVYIHCMCITCQNKTVCFNATRQLTKHHHFCRTGNRHFTHFCSLVIKSVK